MTIIRLQSLLLKYVHIEIQHYFKKHCKEVAGSKFYAKIVVIAIRGPHKVKTQ